MQYPRSFFRAFPVFFAGLTLALVSLSAAAAPLDDYVNAPDSNYSFYISSSEHHTYNSIGYTTYIVRMTSQSWRSAAEVDRPIWRHWLTLVIPDIVLRDIALLVIDGGSNSASADDLEPYAGLLVSLTGSVMAMVRQVPNEPLRFADETFNRTEDAIIAYSFDKFMASYTAGAPDNNWPVLFPMVKSAVRAMDTVQSVAAQAPHNLDVQEFVVGGGSKRGWTTWLTAAVDPRVVACVPIVIDVLKMDIQMDHHYKAYGFYSSAIHDYNDLNIFGRLQTPEGQAMKALVDPYSFADRYTMPKLLVIATGDEFFVTDSSRYYFHDLPGETHLRSIPNSGHAIDADMNSILSIAQYYLAISSGQALPEYSWTNERDGSIRVESNQPVSIARLWQASNTEARDFRWYGGSGPHWTSAIIQEDVAGSGVYQANVAPPTEGWTAYMIELTYPNGQVFTTSVRVTPDCLPFDDSDEDGLLNNEDDDDDADGLTDENDEFPCDTDDDGLSNRDDDDDDGDAIPDEMDDYSLDMDNDGLQNLEDDDDDGDGLPDDEDALPRDSDNDGIINGLDEDDDFDGIPDAEDDYLLDTDNDGLRNALDDDDDDDGWLDTEEMAEGTNWLDPLEHPQNVPLSCNFAVFLLLMSVGGAAISKKGLRRCTERGDSSTL